MKQVRNERAWLVVKAILISPFVILLSPIIVGVIAVMFFIESWEEIQERHAYNTNFAERSQKEAAGRGVQAS